MKGTRTFESQLKRFFEIDTFMKNSLYCGNMMLTEIGEKIRVKISFDCTGAIPGDSALYFGNRYDAVAVTIINKNEGVIDSNFFRFQDICSSHPYFVYTENGEIVWIREEAGDFMKIARKIIAYIKLFAELPEKETVEQKPSVNETIETKESIEQKPIKKDIPEIGDALWYVNLQNYTVIPCTVTHVQCDGSYRMMTVCFYNNVNLRYSLNDYGKLFFLNQKKAYEVLRRKQSFANLKEKLKEL